MSHVIVKPYDKKKRFHAPVDTGHGRTKQSMSAECDINNIMAKAQRGEAITHANRHAANYGFANSHTFHEAMNVIATANTMFADLPSSIRHYIIDVGGVRHQ